MAIVLIFITMFTMSCCKDKSTAPTEPAEYDFIFNFSESTAGWVAGFADYPIGEEDFYELRFERSILPPPLDQNTFSLMISGNNHSDDLFMFLKNKITGIVPNTLYRITFHLEVASQYPENAMGVGGGPGSSVWLKAGATTIEPAPIVRGTYYRMNIDNGNQGGGGEDMIVLSSIGIDGDDFVYTLIQRENEDEAFTAQSDENGDLWLIVGTDSGFESTTTIYYNSINVYLQAM